MIGLEKVRTAVKVSFYILLIVTIISGLLLFFTVYLLFLKPDSIIPIPGAYLLPITAVSVLSIVNGFVGFNCLNSERKTKVFIFILTITFLMNIQILLAISSNRILDHKVQWMNQRWGMLSKAQKKYIETNFKCCGLETITDRSTIGCSFNTPCSAVLENLLRTVRNVSQAVLIYMFFVESLSLCSLSFLKFIK